MKKLKSVMLIPVSVFVAVIMFAGCDNEGAGLPVEPEQPTITIKKVAELTLFCNGNVVAIVDSNANVTGIVCSKMDQNSNIFEVEFLDQQGEVINDDPELYKLAWKNDTQHATFESYSDWEFCIFGTKTGKTDFQLLLNSCGSNCYTSPAIPLEIR